jgi:hypothetical protein
MKAGVGLAPHPLVDAALEPGEECYLQSRMAELFVEEDSPLLGVWMEEEAPREVEGDRLLSFMKRGAIGQLALTSERFIWMSRDRRLTFQLQRVNAAYAQGKRFFVLIYGQRLYKLRFRQESILKWLTYTALVAKHNERMVDHRIALSNY